MSTIRPLATIAILAALGVFLALKINEGPSVALDNTWPESPAPDADTAPAWPSIEETPAADASASTLEPRTAPAWDAEPPGTPTLSPPKLEPVQPTTGALGLPELPPLDEAPAPPSTPEVAALAPPVSPPLPTATNEPLTLPEDIPQARYSDSRYGESESSESASPLSAPAVANTMPVDPPGDDALDTAWPAIQAALDRDELTRAHLMLTQWLDEPTLSPRRRGEIESLVGDLAGTVVYSMEHRLAPPHTVAPGETLATIAQQYNVPWELLAKVNGVASSEAVQPGQVLKVIRGPFAADVRLDTGELVLLIDGRYAGKFPVRVEGQAPADGEWRVGQKQVDAGSLGTFSAGPPQQKVVLQGGAGETIELSAGPVAPAGSSGRLTIASADLADLYDILSIGSPVTIRR